MVVASWAQSGAAALTAAPPKAPSWKPEGRLGVSDEELWTVDKQAAKISPTGGSAGPKFRALTCSATGTLGPWQRRAPGRLSHEDGRQIRENPCGFFGVLAAWARARESDGRAAADASALDKRVGNENQR